MGRLEQKERSRDDIWIWWNSRIWQLYIARGSCAKERSRGRLNIIEWKFDIFLVLLFHGKIIYIELFSGVFIYSSSFLWRWQTISLIDWENRNCQRLQIERCTFVSWTSIKNRTIRQIGDQTKIEVVIDKRSDFSFRYWYIKF